MESSLPTVSSKKTKQSNEYAKESVVLCNLLDFNNVMAIPVSRGSVVDC